MTSALAQLVDAAAPPAGGIDEITNELRLQVAQLGDLLRTYRVTHHENKRRRLHQLHTRLRELTDLLAPAVSPQRPGPADVRQQTVADWARPCLEGVAPELRAREGALRVLEEAFELAQAEGVTPEEATRLQDYVYGRPVGDPTQEVGGVRVALLSYAAGKGLSADRAEQEEILRVLAKPPQAVRSRNREKHAAGVGYFTA